MAQFKTILAATDGSHNATRATDVAIDLSRHYKAKLVILHAVMTGPLPKGLVEWARVEHLLDDSDSPPAPPDLGPSYGRLGVITHEALQRVPYEARIAIGRAVVEKAERAAREDGVPQVEAMLEEGDPAEVIAHAVADQSADLVVLGTRGLGTLKGLLVGSVSQKVVGMHRCPCLTVP